LADSNHLRVLRKGTSFWNKWREENDPIKPDFGEADLRYCQLAEMDLREANFYRANLTGANLRGTKLVKANLTGAKLDHTDLSKTDLCDTYFFKSHLNRANFSGSNLFKANLSGADLREAVMIDANLDEVILNRANLMFAELKATTFHGAKVEKADLRNVNAREAVFTKATFAGSDFTSASLRGANFNQANLCNVCLTEADLSQANFSGTDLSEADLRGAKLKGANFEKASLVKANLMRADISKARIIDTKLNGAILTDSRVFGVSTWDLIGLEETEQSNLVITREDDSIITVDNLEVAQFIYLLLHSEKIRYAVEAITSKVVLILGRFTPERKAVLDALKIELREKNYLPILFDFDNPTSRDITETVRTLAHMAKFIIADITDAKSIPQELATIVPFLPSVPVQPILLSSEKEYGMFEHFKRYNWVLEIFRYENIEMLLKLLEEKIIAPAENKAKEYQKK
jgi:uncharacterized protein YjbI with pentapeptide repeats